MAATVQLNTRIDPTLKERGDAVFARAGLTSSEVVRGVWEYAANTQTVPDFLQAKQEADREARLKAAREGFGIGRRYVEEVMGIRLANIPIDYKQLRDECFEEEYEEMRKRNGWN